MTPTPEPDLESGPEPASAKDDNDRPPSRDVVGAPQEDRVLPQPSDATRRFGNLRENRVNRWSVRDA